MTCFHSFISVVPTVILIARDFDEETLLCRAKGNPTPYVSWIGSDGEVKKNATGEARISIKNEEQGKYTCEATNALGSDQKFYAVTRKNFCWSVSFLLHVVFGLDLCCFLLFFFDFCLLFFSFFSHSSYSLAFQISIIVMLRGPIFPSGYF